ncbi:Virginiamycin B lyase [Cellulomonas sp. T2.31MG-18]|uniref:ScyD/ScyE family protein n=1 Tax=Cellulomonas sp. T2.31MG-18 TaxID=3157619 RepID=UPI0035F00FBE
MRRRLLFRSATAAGAAVLAVIGLAAPSATADPVTISPVITGLSSPRGLTFDGLGSLYVAQAGAWSPTPLTHTGAVTKYDFGTFTTAWTTGFATLSQAEHGPEVLGVGGISALGAGCMKNSNGQRNGCQVQAITNESTDGLAALGLPGMSTAGRLYRLDGATGATTVLADVGDQQYAWTSAHHDLAPADFPDSNPYGVLVTRTPGSDTIRTFVVDAGANTVGEVRRDGTVRQIAYIPNDPVADATPTCVAMGPDGMLYVGTLDLVFNLFVPGGPARSHVWRVDPDSSYPTAPTVWASGLTTVTACTFDRWGNFWAAEMFAPNAAGAPGDVVRIPFDQPTQQTRFGTGSLPLPGGIAQGPDGAMYVTVGSANPAPGSGAVMRLATS